MCPIYLIVLSTQPQRMKALPSSAWRAAQVHLHASNPCYLPVTNPHMHNHSVSSALAPGGIFSSFSFRSRSFPITSTEMQVFVSALVSWRLCLLLRCVYGT